MATPFSTKSTIQLPRVFVFLAVIAGLATALDFAFTGGPHIAVILPAGVVSGLGLYVYGVQRYEVRDDRIRIFGVLGERDAMFEKMGWLYDDRVDSITARLQSFITGAPLSSSVELGDAKTLFSSPTIAWLEDREAFLAAAHEALEAWRLRTPAGSASSA